MRRRVRARLRQSPPDWKEYRRYSHWRNRVVPNWVGRLVFTFIVAAFAVPTIRSIGAFVGIAVFWAIGSVAVRSGQLLITLRSSPRLPVLAHLPISGEQAFQFLWPGFLKSSLWSVADFAVIYTILAYRAGYGVNGIWMALALSVVQWTGILAAAVFLVAYASKGVLRRTGFLFAIPLIAWLAGGRSLQGAADSLAAIGFWLPPTGWTLYVLGLSPEAGFLTNFWPAFSMAAMFLILPFAYRRLRANYVLPEFAASRESARAVVEIARRRQLDGTEADAYAEIKKSIRTREFLAGFEWKRAPWLERITSRGLTPGQRLTAEFLTAARPRWTRRTVIVLSTLCGVAALVYSFPGVVHAMAPFAIGLFVFAANYMSRDWPGTALCQVSGSVSSMFSIYPIGFRQIAGAIIRANLTRTLFAAPLLALAGLLITWAFGMAPMTGAVVVLKCFALIVAYDLLVPVFLVSPGTTDTRSYLLLLAFLCGVLIIGGSGITLFFASGPVAAIACAVLLGAAVGVLKVYGYAYDRSWFDLQRKPDLKQIAPKPI